MNGIPWMNPAICANPYLMGPCVWPMMIFFDVWMNPRTYQSKMQQPINRAGVAPGAI